MRTNILRKLLCGAVLLSALHGTAFAKSGSTELTRFRASGLGGVAIPMGDSGVKENTKSGFATGASLFKELSSHWGLGITYDYFNISNSKQNFDHKGQLVTLSGLYNFSPESRFNPFVEAGVGPGQSKMDRKMDQISARLGAGIEYMITNRLAARGGLNMFYVNRSNRNESNVSMLSPNLGLTYYFGAPKTIKEKEKPAKKTEEIKTASKKTKVEKKTELVCPNLSDADIAEAEVRVQFDLNKDVIKLPYKKALAKVADFLKKCPQATFIVEGHTDRTGPEAYNIGLSQRRAEAVRQVLIDTYGFEASRLTPKGYGFTRPTASNKTEGGRKKNRRAVVVFQAEK